MAEHLIPITISVDDETIEKKTLEYAAKTISDEVMKATHITRRAWGGDVYTDDNTPLVKMIEHEIGKVISENKEIIIEKSSEILADRLCRTKRAKEVLDKTIKESEEE